MKLDSALPSRRTFWMLTRLTLVGGALTLSLLALAYAVINRQGRQAWQKAVDQARAQGFPIEFSALRPPPVADENNFAAHPLIRELRDGYQQAARNGDYHQRQDHQDPFAAPFPAPEQNLDHRGIYAERGEEVLGRWLEAAPSPEALKDWVRASRNQLEQLSAAAARPAHDDPVFPDNFDQLELTFRVELRPAYRLLHLRALLHLEEQQTEDAAEDLITLFRLAGHSQSTPLLLTQINTRQIAAHGLNLLRVGLTRHLWSDHQLSRVDAALVALDALPSARRTYETERTLHALRYLAIADNHRLLHPVLFGPVPAEKISVAYQLFPASWWPLELGAYLFGWDGGHHANDRLARLLFGALPRGPNQILEYLPSGVWQKAAARHLSGVTSLADQVIDFEQRQLRPDVQLRGKHGQPAHWHPLSYALNLDYGPSQTTRFALSVIYHQTQLNLARTALLLERWRIRHGHYPDTLAALTRDLSMTPPHDLIDGDPLRYRPLADGGYQLYSIGENRVDDGGTRSLPPTYTANDWVW